MSRCIYPLTAYKPASGQVTFKRDHRTLEQIQLPCGQCVTCRLERTRQWAVRITHEAQLHEHNYFGTFTYNEGHCPDSLIHKHFQDFLKRLRKRQQVRYFMCGEYGDIHGRPHFHAALFGLQIPDLKYYKGEGDKTLYTSQYMEKIWGQGFCTFGSVTYESAAYVASYITKKIIISNKSPDKLLDHYVDQATGLIREPEYARMSLKPAIAKNWFQKFSTDVTNYDHVIISGREQKPPRYYDKITSPEILTLNKEKRKIKAQNTESQNSKLQLQSLEKITFSKLNLKRKTL